MLYNAYINENYMQDSHETSLDMHNTLYAAFERSNQDSSSGDQVHDSKENDHIDAEISKFYKYLEDAEKELYPNCPNGLSKLSFITELFNLKCICMWTDKSFDLLLKLLLKYFLMAQFPETYIETKKMIGDLGFSYEKIDACPI